MSEYLNLSIMDKKMFITFIKWKKKNYMNLFYKKKKKENVLYLVVPSIQYPSNLTRFLCLTCPNASTSAMKSSAWQLLVIVPLKDITSFFFFFLLKDIHTHYKPKITVG